MQQHLVQQEAERLRRHNQRREQVLDRLWELASMSSEMTRGSITGQVKALSMIVAIEGLIPDRRARSAGMKPAPPPNALQIDPAAWLGGQQGKTAGPQPNPAPDQEDQEDQEEDALPVSQADPAPGSAADAPPNSGLAPGPIFDPSESTFASEQQSPHAAFAPDTRVPFSIRKNPFARRR